MRQLFICTSDAVLAATGKPQDLTNVAAGTIGMWENDDDSKWLAAAPASDFSIAYGRPNSQAVVIPIDFSSARVMVSTPQAGVKFKAELNIPTPVAGKDYTLQLIKLGAVKHERNSWTVTDNGSNKTTAGDMAASLAKQFTNMIEAGNPELDGLAVTVTGTKITIENKTNYNPWELIAADDLVGTKVTTTAAVAPTLDAAYVKNLASVCAQNRGFNNVYQDGASIYPAYPMAVEDTTYKMYAIQFKYGRKYGRTRDEAPIQEVIIVVPVGNSTLTGALDKILDLDGSAEPANTSSSSTISDGDGGIE
uniref:Capsid protein n=1 Tax=Geladintestivirus 4 TaxID=3233136 RepID=A0AAU8MJG1_9CAUD